MQARRTLRTQRGDEAGLDLSGHGCAPEDEDACVQCATARRDLALTLLLGWHGLP